MMPDADPISDADVVPDEAPVPASDPDSADGTRRHPDVGHGAPRVVRPSTVDGTDTIASGRSARSCSSWRCCSGPPR